MACSPGQCSCLQRSLLQFFTTGHLTTSALLHTSYEQRNRQFPTSPLIHQRFNIPVHDLWSAVFVPAWYDGKTCHIALYHIIFHTNATTPTGHDKTGITTTKLEEYFITGHNSYIRFSILRVFGRPFSKFRGYSFACALTLSGHRSIGLSKIGFLGDSGLPITRKAKSGVCPAANIYRNMTRRTSEHEASTRARDNA